LTAPKRHPALILPRLTPAYDLFIRTFMPERRFKRELIAGARINSTSRVLDMGAGTGTLGIMVKDSVPSARISGIDGHLAILRLARQKVVRAQANIAFTNGDVTALPYPSESFDRVLSSLVFSLLSMENKRLAVSEAYRVLTAGGEFHVADYGPAHTTWGRWMAPLVRNFGPTAENLAGVLPAIFQEMDFEDVREGGCFATLFGTLSIVSGRKPV
jgi:ubiquinone/menaquinone biosynthesis C-methylase UbiE